MEYDASKQQFELCGLFHYLCFHFNFLKGSHRNLTRVNNFEHCRVLLCFVYFIF